ncbi:DUF6707 family protein [Arthrobacter sp. Br18]|uniref:DUF6707 family protein n=1 Tax=Arthrobacter sp. Br18 TaxID=1312954 RepID=UPI00047A26D7
MEESERNRQELRSVTAESLRAGDSLVPPGGGAAVEVKDVSTRNDDFGAPALIVAELATGTTVTMASGSSVSIEATGAAEVSAVAADHGSPEAVVARIAGTYPASTGVQELSSRLLRGINLKSGSNLQDLHHLAVSLLVDHADPANALTVADLLTVLPFDGNFGRWKWIEGALAMTAYLSRHDDTRSAAYSAALRSADDAETDPLRAKLAATVRQRQLNDPNVYDPEIVRATVSGNKSAEKDWRVLRLGVLLYLRAHGGSETLTREVLERRIESEIVALSALNRALDTLA